MGLALTTVANGSVISAPDLRGYVEQIETYTNEGIAVVDLDPSDWVESTHIYGGSFYGSPNHRARFETGQTIYRHTGMDPVRQRVFHKNYDTGSVPIEGLAATFCVPESLVQGASPYYDLLVEASFWCYEIGENATTVDERTDSAAVFRLRLDGSVIASSRRVLYQGDGPAPIPGNPYQGGVIYTRKTHHIAHRLAAADVGAGVHNVSVVVDVNASTSTLIHILVGGRTLRASWYVR